ncbi:hypothetical protein [Ornithinimicrobium cavernae]|uniref:hypothetical protein n=1 Tax=Ornithinimicrobium cavernae TaxID=2666047 RepID=UPI000D68992B|nr:hypothetical protein [Ornithinimicrobium cavernae]
MFGIPNPFDFLGDGAAKIIADGWTTAMVAIWSAGLWVLRWCLGVVDVFMTPNLRGWGPMHDAYSVTLWLGLAVMTILTLVQLGAAAFRRDGQSLARSFIGVGQFVVVWAVFIGYAMAVVRACSKLTTGILEVMFEVNLWSAMPNLIAPGNFVPEDITDGMLATVLGFMGLFLWLAAIGHFVVMLTRSAALMVIVVTLPIAAAGLSSDIGRVWFWKSVRWFHAAALTPVLMALVLGIGVKITSGVATRQGDDFAQEIGTAIPGVFLICIACFAPLVLFKLLAFVEPGTSSGAGMRAGLAGVGGVQGLLSGGGGSSAASSTDDQGRSQAELAAQEDTSARAAQATSGAISGGSSAIALAGGPVGAAVGVVGAGVALGLNAMVSAGTKGAVVGADLTNQMGVGTDTYIPDDGAGTSRKGRNDNSRPDNDNDTSRGDGDHTGGGDDGGGGGDVPGQQLPTFPARSGGGSPQASPAAAPAPAPAAAPTGAPAGAAGGAGAAGAGGAGAAGAGGAAAAVPVVPV